MALSTISLNHKSLTTYCTFVTERNNILLSNIKCYWQLLFHPLRQHVYDAILKDNTFTKLSFYEKRGNVSDHNH